MSRRIRVVGLGPAGADLITADTRAAIDAASHRYVRTRRHPAAASVGDAVAFDEVYELHPTFDEVYADIVERLVAAADAHGEVLYAVPGSPLVLERTVADLLADARVDTEVLPAMSFLDLAWARLAIDPVEAGVRLVDGHTFARSAAGASGPLLVAHCHNQRVLSDIKLAVDEPDDTTVVGLSALGTPDERIVEVAWSDLDREIRADHLTSLYVPRLASPVAGEYQRFHELVERLRAECPWDAAQDHRSLRRHLLEETYEVIEAIDLVALDPDAGYEAMEEELGDLLFQILFHSVLATEAGRFDAADVARRVHDKLVARHPHVFEPTGSGGRAGVDEVLADWERAKRAEKGRDSVMDGIPSVLPAALYALKVQKKAASAGLEPAVALGPPGVGADALVRSGLASVTAEASESSIGELLFAAVAVAREHDVDAESALRASADGFARRFRVVEAGAADEGNDLADLTLDELRARWAGSGPHPPGITRG